ncbi:MAG: uracil-DNA glycosylase [Rhodospirillaceae bacterium]|nr:MAG: uracil-DNA glycosylase [Rhodospirillaceae bacterium]
MEILEHPQQILSWYIAAGVDEAMGEEPLDRYALAGEAAAKRAAQAEKMLKAAEVDRAAMPKSGPVSVQAADEGVSEDSIKKAVQLAGAAKTIDDLRTSLASFDGCASLQKTAMNLVFSDGPADAKVMVIGDLPGSDEDRQGVPFVGDGGILLNKMLASIGLDRADVFVANTVFWRPPGKRSAYAGEIAVCLPFVERMIEIVDPQILITLGGPATHSLLAQQGNISKLVGRWFTYETPKMSHPITACGLYHPDFLIKSPAMKRQAWANLLAIQAKIAEFKA